QVGLQFEGLAECVLAVVGRDHLEALQPEVDLDEPHDVAVVVGDQDHLVHPYTSPPSMSSRNALAAAAGSSAPKMAVPTTNTSAPASRHRGSVPALTPPSTWSATGRPVSAMAWRAAAIVGSTRSSNAWPPKPG